MKHLKTIMSLGLVLALNACTHSIHIANMSATDKNTTAGKVVAVETQQKVVLGWTQDTNYVNQAYQQLQDQCPEGNIDGISTVFSTSHGFLSWTNKIKLQGNCY